MTERHQKFEPRTEIRYLCSKESISEIEKRLRGSNFTPNNHQREITQTVYFATPSLKTTSGGVIRMRRYVEKETQAKKRLALLPEEPWFIEVKNGNGQKSRVKIAFGEISNALQPEHKHLLADLLPEGAELISNFQEPLIPIAATQIARNHFIRANMETRVTIDKKTSSFGFIPGRETGELMEETHIPKLEIKTPKGHEEELIAIRAIIESLIQSEPLPRGWQEIMLREQYAKFIRNK